MPKYALLGATGSCGSAVLRSLLKNPPQDLELDILVRSERKLRTRFPHLPADGKALRILQGTSTDLPALQECCRDTSVIFACVGANESKPGMSLVHDTAATIVTALRSLQSEASDAYKPPTVVQLRTASLNPNLSRHTPVIVTSFVKWGMHHLYNDITRACAVYESAAAEISGDAEHSSNPAVPLLRYIFADPPTIHDPDGVECTGYKLIVGGPHPPAVSYADLGTAMCELGQRREEFSNQAVGVIADGKLRETWGLLLWAWWWVLYDRVLGLLTEGM